MHLAYCGLTLTFRWEDNDKGHDDPGIIIILGSAQDIHDRPLNFLKAL